MIDLRSDFLEIVVSILKKYIPNTEVWAFGSRVAWTAKEFSDLDLAIVSSKPLDKKTLVNLEEAFEESDLPIKVDVVEFSKVSKEFQEIIKKNYEVLIANPQPLKGENTPHLTERGLGKRPSLQEDKQSKFSSSSPLSGDLGVQLPDGWKICKLGDIANVNPTETLKKGILAKKVPMDALKPFTKKISFFCTESYSGGAKFKNGDTLIARITPCLENGKTAYVDILENNEIGFGSTEFIVLRESKDVSEKEFLYYLARSPQFRDVAIKSMTGTSGRQRVQNDVLCSHEFLLPPLPEQKEITRILGALDDKIELNRKLNKTLEEIAQTIFKSWFVDFDPVKAKITDLEEGKSKEQVELAAMCVIASKTEEELIELKKQNPKEYNELAETAALFPSEFDESELGLIPKGWGVGRLDEICQVVTGFPFKSSLYSFKEGIKVLRGENVSLGFLRWDTEKRWKDNLDDYKNFYLKENDYVIGMDGSRVGRNRTIIFNSDLPLILAQRVACLRAYREEQQSYLNILLMRDEFEKYIELVKTGTSIPHISSNQIKSFKCLIPNERPLNAFYEFYTYWSKEINNLKSQLSTLQKIRDSLLPKLISGELRVNHLVDNKEG